jgi:glycine cleavage system H lipoate-binding protein
MYDNHDSPNDVGPLGAADSRDHLYIIVEDDVGTVGITKHAQEKLNEVV